MSLFDCSDPRHPADHPETRWSTSSPVGTSPGPRLEDAVATVQRLAQRGVLRHHRRARRERHRARSTPVAAVAAYLEVIDAIAANSLSTPTSRSSPPRWDSTSTTRSAATTSPRCWSAPTRGDLRPHRHGGRAHHRRHAARLPRAHRPLPEGHRRRAPGAPAPHPRRRRGARADGANVRLCKGIYLEPRPIAYEERDIIRNAFVHALRALLDGRRVRRHRHPRRVARRRGAGDRSAARPRQRTATSSRCCSASTRSCAASSPAPATACACTCRSAPTGTRTRCGACARTRRSPASGLEAFLRGRMET